MSRNEWESGTINIPSAQWASFKKNIRDAYNANQDRLFNRATSVYDAITAEAKGQRNFDFVRAVEKKTGGWCEEYWIICDALGLDSRIGSTERRRPTKPKKKDFPHANNKTTLLDMGAASIKFDDKTRCVRWDVDENNHACDRAREHPIGKAFFATLSQVKWTRGSGGEIVGNDEYHRDDEYAGGGANYIKKEYGPKTKAKGLRF